MTISSQRFDAAMTLDSVHNGTHPFLDVVEEFFASPDWPKNIPGHLKRLATTLQTVPEDALHYRLGKAPLESKQVALTACVMATVSKSIRSTKLFDRSFKSFFRFELDQFRLTQLEEMEPGDSPGKENQDRDTHHSTENPPMWQHDLNALGWLQKGGLLRNCLIQAVEETVEEHVRESIANEFETRLFVRLQEWQEQIVQPWLQKLVPNKDDDSTVDSHGTAFMDPAMTVARCFVKVRMGEIFDMVADFPDSLVGIEELKTVLGVTKNMHGQVAEALKETLIRRLNHPGANTLQIIDVYINTIKVLGILDPTDQLLTRVAEPVRQYLQGRQDTVRCIIASLTNSEQGGDLYEELKRQDAKPLEDVTMDSDDEGDCLPDYLGRDTLWQPSPSIHQTHPSFLDRASGGGGKNNDILAMLVSIYGNKELFINEYRLMLADKLLSNATDYNTDQQVHTLELLKLRFGELSMRACEIMLKDINDSKRTNTNIRSMLPDNAVDAIMISHIFWPALQRDLAALKHHPRLQYMLEKFGHEYARLKNPRKLEWLYPLGSVQLELDVHDGGRTVTKKFDCSPPQASLILHFSDQPQWTAQDLSNETGIAVHVVQKQMMYWINHRVVKLVTVQSSSDKEEDAGTTPNRSAAYVLGGCRDDKATSGGVEGLHHHHHHHDDDDDAIMGSGAVSSNAQEEEEMAVFTSYIVGMLSNLGQLPLKTIHNNLKTFVSGSDVKYSKTPQQLSTFLQHLCRQETLECGPDGMYKMFKKT